MIYLLLEEDGVGGHLASMSLDPNFDPTSKNYLQIKLPAKALTDKIAATAYMQTFANILRAGGAEVTTHIDL